MRNIVLVCKYPLQTRELRSFSFECNDQISIMDICKQVISNGHFFSFEEYYGNSCLMAEYGVLPYLISDGIIKWNVPYAEATLLDFINTHDIYDDTIHVSVDNVGGAGDFCNTLYQGWLSVKPLLDMAGYVCTCKSIYDGIKMAFGAKKKNKPLFNEFYKYVMKKDKWDIDDLWKQTGIPKENLVQYISLFGYEYHEGYYWKNSWKVECYNQYVDKEELKLKNNHNTSLNCYWLNHLIYSINLNLNYASVLALELPTETIYVLFKHQMIDIAEKYFHIIHYDVLCEALAINDDFCEYITHDMMEELEFVLAEANNNMLIKLEEIESR